VKVVVLSGGRSSERDVSLRSGASVMQGLREAGHEPIELTISAEGHWKTPAGDVLLAPSEGLLGADVAFPVLHGPFGEDGVLQGVLETLDLPYVGSDVLASAVCMDKLSCKRLLAHHDVPQVDFVQAVDGEEWREAAVLLGYPLWVKPSRLGSSVGITKVDGPEDLEAAVELAARHDPRVIIEASAEGREVEISVLGNEDPETSVPGEIVAHADWYDFEAKYSQGGMELLAPAPVAPETVAEIQELAARVFRLLGCSGLARCDFFVEPDGSVLVNEINTIPGFTETSVYAKLWEASGRSYPEVCDRLVQLAVERHTEARSHDF
jgi:D-alanine-D-alanine ligase